MLGGNIESHQTTNPYNQNNSHYIHDPSNTIHNQSNPQFQLKLKQAGYIVGPPVAFTDNPILPSNFRPFSPDKNNNLPIIFNNTNKQRQLSPNSSKQYVSSIPIQINSPNYHPNNHLQATQIRTNLIHQPINTINVETVPKVQYDRCVTEIKNWETKYNELYLKYLNVTNGEMTNNHSLDNELREENNRLRNKIRLLENRERSLFEKVQSHFTNLVNKYKDSTMKECILLMDRYRLECKHAQKQQ